MLCRGLPKDTGDGLGGVPPLVPVKIEFNLFLHSFGGHDRVLRNPRHCPPRVRTGDGSCDRGSRPLADEPGEDTQDCALPGAAVAVEGRNAPGRGSEAEGPDGGC